MAATAETPDGFNPKDIEELAAAFDTIEARLRQPDASPNLEDQLEALIADATPLTFTELTDTGFVAHFLDGTTLTADICIYGQPQHLEQARNRHAGADIVLERAESQGHSWYLRFRATTSYKRIVIRCLQLTHTR